MKYIKFKRYKFSTAVKAFNTARYNFFKMPKSIFSSLRKYEYNKIYKYFIFRKFNLNRIRRYIDLRRYYIRRFNIKLFIKYLNISSHIRSIKKINLINNKFLFFHLPTSIIFFIFLYLIIPTFYNYDQSDVARVLCKNRNINMLCRLNER